MPTSNLFLAAALAGWLIGCSPYPAATSSESLKLLAALRTACAGQNAAQLANVEQRATQARERGRIQTAEFEALQSIWQQAREGRWREAETACLAYQRAQRR